MDEADIAERNQRILLERKIADTGRDPAPGKAGECELCGEWSGRLVRGGCAPCRDKYRLP